MRATGYINKVSDAWSVHVSSLANVRLFLVARPGPSVFVLKDEEDNTIKTTLGNPHRCSCGVTACVHLAFCIIKVLKVPKEHPLSHQTSLTDNELDLLLSGTLARHTQARAVARSLHPQEPNSPPKPKADAGTVPRQALSEVEEENTCTICQDDMKSDQPLTWCRHGCGNNFHAQCMMKFAGHKISNKQDPSCPLCRELWDMLMLKLDCRVKSAVRHPCHPVSCFNCKCKLRRLFYRCIECSQKSCVGTGGGINGEDRGSRHVDFCPDCFVRMSDVHKTHHFLTSDASIEMVQEVTWHPAKNPLVSTLPPAHLTALQTRELTVNDYDLLLQLDSSPEKSIVNALLDALPSVSREVVTAAPTKYKGGGCVCDSDSSQLMVLMPCGHVMHRQCLKQDIACLAEEDLASLGDYRCTHEGCGKGVFFCLRRRKKRSLPNPGASSSGKAETEASKADKNRHLMDSSTRPQITMLPSIVGAALVGQGTSGGGGGIGNLMPVDNAILRQALQSRSHTQPRVRRHTADNTRLAPSLTLEAGRSYTAEASAVLPSVSLGKTLIGKRTPRGIGTLRSTGKPPLTSSFPLALEAVPLLHTQENILNAHRNDSSEMLVSVSARGFEDVRARGKIGVGFGVGAGGGGGLSGNGGGTIGRSFAGIGGVGMGPGFGGLSHGGSSGDMHGGGHGERDGEGLRVVSSSIMRSTSDLDLQGLSTTMMDSMRMPPVRRPPMLTRPTPASIRRSLVATEVENSDSLNQLLVVNYR